MVNLPLKIQCVRFLVAGSLVLLMLGVERQLPVLAQSSAEPAVVVEMTNELTFAPDTVHVESGQTVRWENSSVIVHTVTADPAEASLKESVVLPDGAAPFDSGTLDQDESFEHTFEVPGTYRYFCIPHEGTKMYGTVVVESADE